MSQIKESALNWSDAILKLNGYSKKPGGHRSNDSCKSRVSESGQVL